MRLLERVAQSCAHYRGRPAFFIAEKLHTYGSFAEQVASLRGLLEREAPNETRVGVLAYDDIETYAAIFAVWFSGKTVVPINPTHPLSRNAAIFRVAELHLVLSSRSIGEVVDLCEQGQARLIVSAGHAVPGAILDRPAERSAEDHAYILFTSGSTGVPKGVPIPDRALDGFLDAFGQLGFALDFNDRFLQMFDLTFDLSLMSYCVPLALGACVYTVPPESIKYAYSYTLLDEQRITCALMVPSLMTRMRPYFSEMRLPDLKISLFCGEALYSDLVDEWSRCVPNARILNVYGPTEATIFCSAYECLRERNHKTVNGVVSIGQPMEGVQMRAVDGGRRFVQQGEPGELCLSGRQVTPGYWRDPERNSTAFFVSDGAWWYRTGDLCVVDADGDFMYIGRADSQVKVQGYRVELGEIEHHVRLITGLKHVAAVSYQDGAGDSEIHLFVEGSRGGIDTVIARLRTSLPAYMIPTRTTVLDALPLNVNGKIDRRALQETAAIARSNETNDEQAT